jgi:hypothetical protein
MGREILGNLSSNANALSGDLLSIGILGPDVPCPRLRIGTSSCTGQRGTKFFTAAMLSRSYRTVAPRGFASKNPMLNDHHIVTAKLQFERILFWQGFRIHPFFWIVYLACYAINRGPIIHPGFPVKLPQGHFPRDKQAVLSGISFFGYCYLPASQKLARIILSLRKKSFLCS